MSASPHNWAAILKDALARGLSVTEVALEVGVTVPTVCKAAARRCVKLQDKRGLSNNLGGPPYTAPRATKFKCPDVWDLTSQEAQLVAVLVDADDVVPINDLLDAITRRKTDPKILDVLICRVRKKLAKFNVSVERKWGKGVFIHAETKASLRAGAVKPKHKNNTPPLERAA